MREKVNLVLVQTHLSLLRHFLEHVIQDAVRELNAIEERRQGGDIASSDDPEQSYDLPVARIQIAARAVANELAALVEGQLHHLAHEPWLSSASPRHKGPKNILQLPSTAPEEMARLRQVSDLRFDDVVKLIKGYYGIQLSSIEGWSEIEHLRAAVNAQKHRHGLKHPREIDWRSKGCAIPQWHKLDTQEAAKAITDVATFFRNLRAALVQVAT